MSDPEEEGIEISDTMRDFLNVVSRSDSGYSPGPVVELARQLYRDMQASNFVSGARLQRKRARDSVQAALSFFEATWDQGLLSVGGKT